MHRFVSLSLFAAVLCPAALQAQVTPHERALPKFATGAWGNAAATYNITRDATRLHQTWYRGDNLPTGYIVLEIGERVGKTASAAMSLKITLVLDNSSISWAQMQADPTKNLSASAAKLFDKVLNLPADAGMSSPNHAQMWMKLDRPFPYTGPHLVIDRTWTPQASASGLRRYDVASINPTTILTSGTSCGGTLTCAYANGTWTGTLTNGGANGVALFMVSTENVTFGPIGLPFDLGVIGLKGCELGIEPQFLLPVATDANGGATLSIPFATPTETVWWATQVLHTSGSSWATTEVATTALGGTGLMRQLRVDKRGTNGPGTFDQSGPVLLVRGR